MQTTTYRPSQTTTVRYETMGKGRLKIRGAYKDGQLIGEAFTLESLAHVLDMPMSTIDGRYARGKLAKWSVPIINGYGRPARGFPLPLLNDVIAIITTKGACVGHDVNGSGPAQIKPVRQANDLRPEYFAGQQYFTVPSLSYAFGYSETTIRKKLERAGLMCKFVNLASPEFGGRPKRGIPAKYLADVKLAITEGVTFMTGMERALHAAGYEQAKADMQASIAPHEPPPPNSLRAWDRSTMAPVVPVKPPVNAVNPAFDADLEVGDLMAQLEHIVATAMKVPAATIGAAPDHVPAPSTGAPEEEPHVIAQRMWEMQRDALVAQDDEPTPAEYRDTCDMLALDKAASERFVAEVKAARGGV